MFHFGLKTLNDGHVQYDVQILAYVHRSNNAIIAGVSSISRWSTVYIQVFVRFFQQIFLEIFMYTTPSSTEASTYRNIPILQRVLLLSWTTKFGRPEQTTKEFSSVGQSINQSLYTLDVQSL
jgi:hypothetical protein